MLSKVCLFVFLCVISISISHRKCRIRRCIRNCKRHYPLGSDRNECIDICGMTGCKLLDGSTIAVGKRSPPAPVCGPCVKCVSDGNLVTTTCMECIKGQNRVCELMPSSGSYFCICIPNYSDEKEEGICTEGTV